jgi:chemotaxis protein CheC
MITREEFDDALAELVNVGVGRAAASLSTMVKEKIDLSVPKVATISFRELNFQLGLDKELSEESLVSIVQQPFVGKVGGTASILFPLSSARKLVGLLTDGLLTAEELDLEMEAALTEVGNILINGVMGTIGNITGMEINFQLPEYQKCSTGDLEQSFQDRDLMLAMVLIAIQGQEIKGHLILLFDLPSLESLQQFIEQNYGDGH